MLRHPPSDGIRLGRVLPCPVFRTPLILLCAVATAACGAQPRTRDPRPDVILILADDLSHRIGLYGSPARTPALETLAERGRRFDRAYCQYPLCNPSRTSLFTGWRPERTAVWGNLRNPAPYVRDAVPLQEHFERNGYFTARVGKAYHSRFEDEFRWSHVFDTYGGEETAGDGTRRWGPSRNDEDALPDGRAARHVVELLSAPRAQPLFIVMGLLKPHEPWVVPEEYFGMYPPESVELPPSAPVPSSRPGRQPGIPRSLWREALAAYRASVSFADAQIGRVLETLDRHQRWNRTIVIVTADNGIHLGEHGFFGKHTLYEEAARVPLVIAAPGVKGAGRPTGRVVELVDLYPTLVDLCGLPPVAGLDGVSLRPILEDPSRGVKEAAFTMKKIGATREGRIAVSARTERYRYTAWPGGGEELYDHETDPDEMRNLARLPEAQATLEGLRRLSDTLPEITADRMIPGGSGDAAADEETDGHEDEQ